VKHLPATDAIIEVLLGVFTEEQLAEIVALVPEHLSAPLDEEERIAWIDLAADLHDEFPSPKAIAEVAAIYAQTPGGFTIAGIEYMPTNVINIVKSITAGECSAKRCGSESVENVMVDGRKVPLCQRHIDAMVLSGQIVQGAAERTLTLPHIETTAVGVPQSSITVLSSVDPYTAELSAETEAAKADLAAIEDFEIATQDDMDLASAVISEAKERSGKLEARMQEITKPMRAAEKSVRDLFRPALTALGDIERIVKGKVGAYRLEQDARNAAALKAAAEAVARGEDATKALAGVVHTENTAGLSTRDVVKWEVLDEDAVPRELCSPDDRKIRVAIKDEHTVIPGLRIYKDVSVISRKA
jgi:hypothetical protein